MAETQSDLDKAHQWARRDLADAGIDPDSPAGRDFLFRADAFGIMGVQPPRPELNKRWEKIVGPDAVFIHG